MHHQNTASHVQLVIESEELFDDIKEHLIGEAHGQQWVAGVRKHVVLQRAFEGLGLKDGKELLGCIEVENVDHHLGHVELQLKELVVRLGQSRQILYFDGSHRHSLCDP